MIDKVHKECITTNTNQDKEISNFREYRAALEGKASQTTMLIALGMGILSLGIAITGGLFKMWSLIQRRRKDDYENDMEWVEGKRSNTNKMNKEKK
jgi:hypothetical protein